jgi:tetratricopeptide (TPR) repeat protein
MNAHGQTYFIYPKQKNATESAADKSNSERNVEKAYEAYNSGDLKKTRYYLDQSERNGWTSASFYYLLGMWSYDTGNRTAARRYWMRGYHKRSCWDCKVLAEKMDNGQAISGSSKSKSAQIDPESEEGYYIRAIASYHKKDLTTAISYLSSCLNLNPENSNALFYRGLIKSELDDRYGAINDYGKIISNKLDSNLTVSDMATVYNNKAYCLVQLGNFDEALPLVSLALEMDSTKGYIWDTRGEIYYNKKDYSSCIKDMDKSNSLKELANSFYFRGLSKLQLNDKLNGCLDLSRAGELGETKAFEAIKMFCK